MSVDLASVVARGRVVLLLLVLQAWGPAVLAADRQAEATLRVGLATEPLTFDPHAMNAGSTTLVNRSIFEALVGRGEKMEKLPQLATSWSRVGPRRWRFVIRSGVRFHDGSPLTVDDVIFSLRRAASARSEFKVYTSGIKTIERVDASTVDIVTEAPDEVLLDKLTRVFIVSKAWEQSHGLADPSRLDSGSGVQITQANGTGPYRVASGSAAAGPIEMTRFDGWWGRTAGEKTGNVVRVIYEPIPVPATRVAALMSDDVDLILDAPPPLIGTLKSKPDIKVISTPENRTIVLGLDHRRAKLEYSDAATNPFKDLRVRRAISLAIDTKAIRDGLMDGFSVPAGSLIAPSIFGYSEKIDRPVEPDVAAARRLMNAAGYQKGFSVTLDCPAHRYVNDERLCAAVASMLSRIGIVVRVNVTPVATWYGKVIRHDTSFFLMGWASPTFDGEFSLRGLLHTPSAAGGPDGAANGGRYSNPDIDALIDGLAKATNAKERAAMIGRALQLAKDDVAYVPLHHQMLVWAMKRNVDAVITPEGQLDVKWVTVH